MQKERGGMVILSHFCEALFTDVIIFSPGDIFSTRIKQVQILYLTAEYYLPQHATDSRWFAENMGFRIILSKLGHEEASSGV